MTQTQSSPASQDLPPAPEPELGTFWCAAADLAALRPPAPAEVLPALERLGPSPFPKSRFRFLSFLATVYDHVAARVEAGEEA